MAGTGTFVIVGGGLAAAKAAEALRDEGYDGRLVLVGEEHHLPYERPPLSKSHLLGKKELEDTLVHAPEWYDERDVDLRLGTRATALDLVGRTVSVGEELMGFGRLLVATGAMPRRLAVADDSGAPVTYLRTLEDSRRIKEALRPGQRLCVVGGGWIGLEVAAAARVAGCEVTVLEALQLPLLRVLGHTVAQVFADLHRQEGVDLRVGTSITAIEHDDGTAVVRLDDGASVTADLLLVGVGVSPAVDLARSGGLDVDDGILTDAQLRTSHPDVFAAGDVANAQHPVLGRRVRVEHWDNAIAQGTAAARNMLGAGVPYDRLPYFFTDQYDLGMEYVGHVGPDGADEVVLRGDPADGVFSAFWLQGARVVAGMHVNDWDAIDPIRAVVTAGTVDVDALRDVRVPLSDLVD